MPMEYSRSLSTEAARPDFAAFAAGVRTRLAQHHALPPDAVHGVARLGRLVYVLRTRQHWSVEALATRTGLSWLWLALLEQGMLLPHELTTEAVHQLGRAFPLQHGGADPAALFHALAEDLQHLHWPAGEAPAPRDAQAPGRPPLGSRLVHWLTPIWEPLLAGQLVTAAAETPEQTQVFTTVEGEMRLTCEWHAASGERPALLRLAWHADLTGVWDFWVRFTRPDDPTVVLAVIPLGRALAGEEVWAAPALGFDPTRDPWAVTLGREAAAP